MIFFRPKEGHANTALDETQLAALRDVIRVVARTLGNYVETASNARKHKNKQDEIAATEHAATLSDTLNGLIRIRDRGGSVREFVGEFSLLAMHTIGAGEGCGIMLQRMPIELCKKDPGLYAYGALDKQHAKQDAVDDKMLLEAADKARAKLARRKRP